MKSITVVACITLLSLVPVVAVAQPPAPEDTLEVGEWVNKAKLGLGLTQSSLSSNWTGDEVGTLAWLSNADFLSDGQWTPKVRLTNTLLFTFGQTHQQVDDGDTWLAPQKSADRIDYDGISRFTLGAFVDPYLALAFDSQFYQRVGDETRPFDPWLLSESAGIARAFWDTKTRSLVTRLGFALRQRHDAFAVPPLDKTTHDGGVEWRTVGRLATAEDETVFSSELTLFQAVFFSGEDEEFQHFGEDRWRTTDVRWQNTLSNKLNKWMSVGLYFEFLFDEQLDKGGQFKETLGLGLTAEL